MLIMMYLKYIIMDYRMIILISFLALFLTLGFCSANDENDVLSDSGTVGSFSELQNLIDEAPENGVVSLDRNYSYLDNDEFQNGVQITKALTIDGNNHVLDANGKSRIFEINFLLPNLVLKNIVFANGKTSEWGGAVSMHDGEIINCTFINNTAYFGGAIDATYGKLVNLTCLENSAVRGGALSSYNVSVYNSYFKDNNASLGGAIEQSNGNVYNSIFINNRAEYGGAIRQDYIDNNDSQDQKESNVYDCLFINNLARLGGAIYQENSHVYNSRFINNTASEHGGAIFEKERNVVDCIFENNSAGDVCDNICVYYNHTSYEPSNENIAQDNSSNGNIIPAKNISSVESEIKTIGIVTSGIKSGNPFILLMLALIFPIIRIKK